MPSATNRAPAPDLGAYVRAAAAAGELVVQPRMGMARPEEMSAGVGAVASLAERTVATITLDSYTRVGNHAAATAAVRAGQPLNGFPLVSHGPRVTAQVAAAAGRVPVQIRHGSADPMAIFRTMAAAGLGASEGGPVSYCLPYGRTPLAESIAAWRDSVRLLADESRSNGIRAHLETFGGCMLGQLCPPSLLIAISALEALFFAQHGITSVSLSYAQQTHHEQDAEALTALRLLADELLPKEVDRHLVLYTYMGVFPRTIPGARLLLARSAELAVRGGAERLIVKTETEAHRIPTVAENLVALRAAATQARRTRETLADQGGLPFRDGQLFRDGQPVRALRAVRPGQGGVDAEEVLTEARALVTAVLSLSDNVGTALQRAFHRGLLDVPYCLHPDNRGATRGIIASDGRLRWAELGAMPLTSSSRTAPLTSGRLATMLRHVADDHDYEAEAQGGSETSAAAAGAGSGAGSGAATVSGVVPLLRPAAVEEPVAQQPLRVAVVGMGPRGLSVLERLVARAAEQPLEHPVMVHVIDPHDAGAGRIWRQEQSPHFLMNTAAKEVTMFSGATDDGPARPGAGPTLAEWWAQAEPETAEPEGFAPRVVYGRYLSFVFERIMMALPANLTVHRVRGQVLTADRIADLGSERSIGWGVGGSRASTPRDSTAGVYRLRMNRGDVLTVDRLVLATGHPSNDLDCEQKNRAAFAAAHPPLQYIVGESANDMPLSHIPPGSAVGVVGMGLTFYDLLAELTLGRGGKFVPSDDGLRYVPSGREPRIYPASRGGIPLLTRGANQKGPFYRYTARLFTPVRMAEVRSRGPVDFYAMVLPWLMAEINLVLLETRIRNAAGPEAAARFAELAVAELGCAELPRLETLSELAAAYCVDTSLLHDLNRLARPFSGVRFGSPEEFRKSLAEWLRADLAEARLGNADGPLKAAFDVLRDVRQTIRSVVDFGGLCPESHRRFLSEFNPVAALVSTGPPPLRTEQFLALVNAGILDPVGPQARFRTDEEHGRFTICSPQVENSRTQLDVLVDARVPSTDLRVGQDPLLKGLLADGVIRTFVNTWADHAFNTGGLASTDAPFHPVRADGTIENTMHVIGIPSEHTRWFTQVGSGRPGPWGSFTKDADAIAVALLGQDEPAPAHSAAACADPLGIGAQPGTPQNIGSSR
ncbi:FAD/NAD(P)-binding protein [Kitasatospora sp. McL0602]|uniref:FAD/NAD(P)-binding protein n=1 Tax=Kitasatospora sp. McL0602 TaxID=3439530 RepID=UPI003F8A1CFC